MGIYYKKSYTLRVKIFVLESDKMKKIISLICTLALILGVLMVPLNIGVSAEGSIPSVEIKENEAFVFDFTDTASRKLNDAAATGADAIGY